MMRCHPASSMASNARENDVATHRALLNVRADASPAEIRAAFIARAKATHPDATRGRDARAFDDAVRARDALIASSRATRNVEGYYTSYGSISSSSSSAHAGKGHWRAYALMLLTPAFAGAAVCAFALPKAKTYESGMGRVRGVMNAPVNPWLREDAMSANAKANEKRLWRRVFGGDDAKRA